ncbi:MAG: divalent-cation tolerance protein CutA [Hyphomonas sp.]|uniref:divalent-cation tolerance protein CutA n=1 Tax=Hyphomonas sp. TaxID=87 RepID=UPI00181D3CA7|nr:divalent-cation tolerance protein CutA [Hyphomonas sp.]MBU3919855.1 divalent-cation tolerance protein CutA [Alphaproteobacteria bacterium]MBA3068975.1 divalent-cation tolerance protein CutA [Hyphomonas sp.]MBU4061608.1 divalent-cation tolerance protein CutA [Alphaproteobacteria bacterium]MBU4163453.1 divalent-cation tolerance protein CutA [Alphaproteobacteria bacterium]MBU4569614.1 divalent-cation tolerance protein CutA [Alphaproteobacteria bacterium]
MTKLILLRITCPSRRVAEDIADASLETRLAASANIEGPVTSSYRWKGVIEQSFEFILWLKAPEVNWPKLEALVRKHHPYDVPAIVAMPLTHVSDDYAAWAAGNTES